VLESRKDRGGCVLEAASRPSSLAFSRKITPVDATVYSSTNSRQTPSLLYIVRKTVMVHQRHPSTGHSVSVAFDIVM